MIHELRKDPEDPELASYINAIAKRRCEFTGFLIASSRQLFYRQDTVPQYLRAEPRKPTFEWICGLPPPGARFWSSNVELLPWDQVTAPNSRLYATMRIFHFELGTTLADAGVKHQRGVIANAPTRIPFSRNSVLLFFNVNIRLQEVAWFPFRVNIKVADTWREDWHR
jgi:hypothetical protein